MHTVPLLAYTVTMDARPSTLPTLLAAVLLGWCAPGLAATVYKTTDDSGAVSFSDKPPADATAAETIHIDTAPPLAPEESARRLEATRATTERMAADRREREQHRAELRTRRAEAERSVPEPAPTYTIYTPRTYPYYYPIYPIRWPGRPHHRPHTHPGHPDAQPPLRPREPPPGASSNAQLMRPLVSKRP